MTATTPAIEQAEAFKLMQEFYLSDSYSPVPARRADTVQAAIGFALARQRQAFEAREARLREALQGFVDDLTGMQNNFPKMLSINHDALMSRIAQARAALGGGK